MKSEQVQQSHCSRSSSVVKNCTDSKKWTLFLFQCFGTIQKVQTSNSQTCPLKSRLNSNFRQNFEFLCSSHKKIMIFRYLVPILILLKNIPKVLSKFILIFILSFMTFVWVPQIAQKDPKTNLQILLRGKSICIINTNQPYSLTLQYRKQLFHEKFGIKLKIIL